MPARVYVMVIDADGEVLTRRYIHAEQVPAWLTIIARPETTVRCDVYDDAPPCGGKQLTSFVPHERTWREQAA
jgi:hypothetical protein